MVFHFDSEKTMNKTTFILTALLIAIGITALAEIKAGDKAPVFQIKTHEGGSFSLADRKGQWTVLYFYPKADTPGCTKQACAFRDNILKIKEKNAEVFGVSVNTVKQQADFH